MGKGIRLTLTEHPSMPGTTVSPRDNSSEQKQNPCLQITYILMGGRQTETSKICSILHLISAKRKIKQIKEIKIKGTGGYT